MEVSACLSEKKNHPTKSVCGFWVPSHRLFRSVWCKPGFSELIFLSMCAPPCSRLGERGYAWREVHGGRLDLMSLWITVISHRISQVWFWIKRGYRGISWVGVGHVCMLMLRVVIWFYRGFLFVCFVFFSLVVSGVLWGFFCLFFNIASWTSASSSENFHWIQQNLSSAISLWSCVIVDHSFSNFFLPA